MPTPANQPLTLPIVDFMPDQPPFQNPGSAIITNAMPKTQRSYGPISGLTPYSGALPLRCQGSQTFLDSSDNVNIFAGDATDLFVLTSASTNFTKVSKSPAAYDVDPGAMWNFVQFGARVIGSDINDPMQSFTMGVGTATTFIDLAAAAPKAKYLAVVRNFLVGAWTNDPSNGNQPQRVWWSSLNDPTNWPTPGTASAAQVQSDFNDLLGQGGWIYGIVGNLGTADGAVFMEEAVWRMVYAGPPSVFYFFPAEGVRGTRAPASIVQLGPLVFYYGRDGFYSFDGTNSTPIGANRVDAYFNANVDVNNLGRIVGAVDPSNKLIYWAWPDKSASNGNPNNLLGYHWQLNKWGSAKITTEYLVTGLTFGYTLDNMNSFGTFDSMPQYPLDSTVWTGGAELLAAFDTSHMLNFFNGNSLAPVIETSEVELPFAGRLGLVKNGRPLVTGPGSVPTLSVGYRSRLTGTVTYTTASTMNAIGTAPIRAPAARYVRAQIAMSAGDPWQHVQGVELEVSAAGAR